jgi:hypothetical protein
MRRTFQRGPFICMQTIKRCFGLSNGAGRAAKDNHAVQRRFFESAGFFRSA